MSNPETNTGDEQSRIDELNSRILASQSAIDSSREVIDRMDHKDELYGHLGDVATGAIVEEPQEVVKDVLGRKQFDSDGNLVKTPGRTNIEDEGTSTRTIPERIMARRLESKRWKREVEQADRDITVKAFGGEKSNSMSLSSRAKGRVEVARHDIDQITGNVSPREARLKKIESRANTPMGENAEQKRTRNASKRVIKRTGRAARQPILSRWRDGRRNRANSRVEKHEQAVAAAQEEIDRISQASNSPEDNLL